MSTLDRLAVIVKGETDTRFTRRNPPGLHELTYQGGRYRDTLLRMLARLATLEQLARLNPEAHDDWAIALLHATAVVTDVLAFYQERITNEGYLTTSVDRRSVLELARAIGYELRPALGATAHLALTVPADDKGQPQSVKVPRGSAVQGIPGEGKLPQIFETSTETVVRSDWNQLRPVVSKTPEAEPDPEPLRIDETSLRVANYRTDLRPNDIILLTDGAAMAQPASLLGTIQTVDADPQKPYTLITWKTESASGEQIERPQLFVFRRKAKLFAYPAGAVYFNAESPLLDGTGTTVSSSIPPALAEAAPPDVVDPSQPETTGASGPVSTGQWTPRTLGLPDTLINTLVATAAGELFAGTKFDVFRSRDDGATWQPAGVDLVPRNIMALTFAPDGALFAGSNTGGIYMSRDSAENWTPVSGDSIAPNSAIEDSGKKKKVVYDQILPKAPVRELEVVEEDGKPVVYAGTDKGIFRSYDEGKVWEGPLKTTADGKLTVEKDAASASPAESASSPDNGAQPAALPVTTVVTSVTLAQRAGQFLQKLGPLLANVGSAAKALGIDFLGLVTPWFGPEPQETPINTLAVDASGRKPTLLLGTDVGKFRLQGDARRWLWVAIILALVMLAQFLTNRGSVGSLSFGMQGSGPIRVESTTLAQQSFTSPATLTLQGTVKIDPRLPMTDTVTAPMTFVAESDLTVQPAVDGIWVGTGSFDGSGSLTDAGLRVSDTVPTAELFGIAVLTLTAPSGVTLTGAVTQPVTAHLVVTATGVVTAESSGSVSVAAATVTFDDGMLSSQAAGAFIFPWLAETWQWTVDLLQSTVVASIDAVQSFLQALWAMVPDPIKTVLMPVYDIIWGRILQPIFEFINKYLVQPLLNYTAATLAQASLIALGIWLLRKLWLWLQQKWLNRAGVRIDAPVNDLLIRDNGQIFAGTAKGIYRSLENDPQTPLPTRIARIATRTLFKDRVMQPVNEGLTANEGDPLPDIRALALTATGAILAGAADGRLFRSENNGDSWLRYDTGLTLQSVRRIVPMAAGEFVAGAPGDAVVEDAWYTTQLAAHEIDLAAAYDDIKPGSWIILAHDADPAAPPVMPAPAGIFPAATSLPPTRVYERYAIGSVEQVVPRSYGNVTIITRVTVPTATPQALAALRRAQTEVLLQSEAIPLFDNRPVGGDTLAVQGYLPDLRRGHTLILSGKPLAARVVEAPALPLRTLDGLNTRALLPGDLLRLVVAPVLSEPVPDIAADPDKVLWRWHVRTRDGFEGTVDATRRQIRLVAPAERDPLHSEIVVAESAFPHGEQTDLKLAAPLGRVYDRATVTLAGNIVEATQGSTVEGEILGSGSGRQSNERLVLPEKPLTYLAANNESGRQTTLGIAINGILWHELPSLYEQAPGARVFVVRHGSDDSTAVIFGDGKQGARLPTGTEHVTATYRIGSGPNGNVPAGALTQLQNFPAGVQKATNPLPASGGVAAEETERAREMAPLSVRGLGRIVSLSDYEDFARTFSGIGRVLVASFGSGKRRVLHLTVADADGNPIGDDAEQREPGTLLDKLEMAIDAHRATPVPHVVVQSYERIFFGVTARLVILPDHVRRVKAIEHDAAAALVAAFSFARRTFGQAVAESEVVAVLSGVDGVCAVKVVALRLHGEDIAALGEAPDPLTARLARQDGDRFRPAQLLLINPTTPVLDPAIKVKSRAELGICLEIVAQNAPAIVLNDPMVPA